MELNEVSPGEYTMQSGHANEKAANSTGPSRNRAEAWRNGSSSMGKWKGCEAAAVGGPALSASVGLEGDLGTTSATNPRGPRVKARAIVSAGGSVAGVHRKVKAEWQAAGGLGAGGTGWAREQVLLDGWHKQQPLSETRKWR